MNIRQQHQAITALLEASTLHYGQYTDDADQEALWLLLYVLQQSPTEECDIDTVWGDENLTAEQVHQINKLVDRRINERMPLPYLVNQCWFAGMQFYIDERAIIPRSYLVEWIDQGFAPWVDVSQVSSVLDLCTGSGCLAVCCAQVFPEAQIVASDISDQALQVAQINISRFGLEKRINLNQGNTFENIKQRFDLIVCNPPYVSIDSFEKLPAEYQKEPQQAFVAGSHGLDFIIRLLTEAKDYLTENGVLLIEVATASVALEKHLPNVAFTWLATASEEKAILLLSADDLRIYNDLL